MDIIKLIIFALCAFSKPALSCVTTIDKYAWLFNESSDTLISGVTSPEACLQKCIESGDGCQGYTWQHQQFLDVCLLIRRLQSLERCESCISGTTVEPVDGGCGGAADHIIDEVTAGSAQECWNMCVGESQCTSFTWFNSSSMFTNTCFMFSSCFDVQDCFQCVSGRLICIEDYIKFTTSSSTKYPTTPYPSTTRYPTTPYPTTTRYPTTPYPSTTRYPTTTYPSTTRYPTTPYPSTTRYPTTPYPTSTRYPTTPYPSTTRYPTTPYPSTTRYPTTPYPTTTRYPTTPYPSTTRYPTTPYPTTTRYPTTPYPSTTRYPTTTRQSTTTPSTGRPTIFSSTQGSPTPTGPTMASTSRPTINPSETTSRYSTQTTSRYTPTTARNTNPTTSRYTPTTSRYNPTTSGSLPSQCNNYKVLDDMTRSVNSSFSNYCDEPSDRYTSPDWSGSGYYRVLPPAGNFIADSIDSAQRCGTDSVGYLMTHHPSAVGESVDAKVCFTKDGNPWIGSCDRMVDVKITNCNGYFVYYLVDVFLCSSRYCAADNLVYPK